jgi:hypothetical protein
MSKDVANAAGSYKHLPTSPRFHITLTADENTNPLNDEDDVITKHQHYLRYDTNPTPIRDLTVDCRKDRTTTISFLSRI